MTSRTLQKPGNRTFGSDLEGKLLGLLLLGFYSLFLGLRASYFVKFELFDLLCLATLVPLGIIALTKQRIPSSPSFYVIILFFVVEASSALVVSTENFAREALQAVEMIYFAFVLDVYRRRIEWRHLMIQFLWISLGVAMFSAAWHIAHGYYSGWKQLGDIKLIFSYGQVPLFAWMLLSRRKATFSDIIILCVVAMILVLSGERKALGSFVICLLACAYVGFIRLHSLIFGAILLAGPMFAIFAMNPYVHDQLMYFVNGGGLGNLSMAQLMSPTPDLAPSNVQREFARRLAWQLFQHHPLFGIGTNAYLLYIKSRYFGLPTWMYLGIHGEFLRTLAENGMVGLIFYILPWIRTVWWLIRRFRQLDRRLTAIYICSFVTIFNECAFEGGGTRAFLAYIVMALLPELFALPSMVQRRRVAPTLTPVPQDLPVPSGAGPARP